jgi:hypothetical protein
LAERAADRPEHGIGRVGTVCRIRRRRQHLRLLAGRRKRGARHYARRRRLVERADPSTLHGKAQIGTVPRRVPVGNSVPRLGGPERPAVVRRVNAIGLAGRRGWLTGGRPSRLAAGGDRGCGEDRGPDRLGLLEGPRPQHLEHELTDSGRRLGAAQVGRAPPVTTTVQRPAHRSLL